MIKFELPDGDASALHHIGVALQNIAAELRGEVVKPQVIERTRTVGDMSVTEKFAEVDTVSEQYASLAKDGVVKREGPFYWSTGNEYGMVDTEAELIEMLDNEPLCAELTEEEYNALSDANGDNPTAGEPTDPKLPVGDVVEQDGSAVDHVAGVETDTNGLPWDKRIHSANRTKNADGSWRNARQPKAFDGDWAEYIKSVESELRGAMGGQTDNTPPPPADDVPPPPVTDVPPPPVTDVPPPPVTDVPPPPVVEESTPFDQDVPPPPSDNLEPKTFPELMKLITENAKEKGAVAKVQEIIAAHNYGSLQTLSSVGAEAVTIVYHELKAKL